MPNHFGRGMVGDQWEGGLVVAWDAFPLHPQPMLSYPRPSPAQSPPGGGGGALAPKGHGAEETKKTFVRCRWIRQV